MSPISVPIPQKLKAILKITVITCLVLTTTKTTNAQITTACSSSAITKLTPCFSYLTGISSPTKQCCDSLGTMMSDSMDCTCLIVTGNVPITVPFVNRNLAISLPQACQSSVPLQCKASGDPLPAPGPVLFRPPPPPISDAPVPAPSHGHGHSHINHSPSPSPNIRSPKASKAVAVEEPTPPKFPLGPSGTKSVVNEKSKSNQSDAAVSLFPSNLLVLVVGVVMAFNFI